MSNKPKKKPKPRYIANSDPRDPWDVFGVALQCGECYVWYDALKDKRCPVCNGDEVVGDR